MLFRHDTIKCLLDMTMLVTIGIIAWNRYEDTLNAVKSAFSQPYRPIEVILIDTSANYYISKALLKEFSDVRVIRVHKNLGCPGGRNIVFANANGEIVLNIDDDSTIDLQTVSEVVHIMSADENIAVVACQVVNLRDGQQANLLDENRSVMDFNGQCAIRTSALDFVGYYPDSFLRQGEETHLALRILDHGFKIVYAPRAVINHHQSPVSRNNKKFFFYTTRNELQTVLELAPWYLVPVILPYKILALGWNALKNRCIHYMMLGLVAFLYRVPTSLLGRKATSIRPWWLSAKRRFRRIKVFGRTVVVKD